MNSWPLCFPAETIAESPFKMKKQTELYRKIWISGHELVELKRHAYQIPECPGLDKRLQNYKGDKPFVFTPHELEWLVCVLDAVLKDPKGYPVVEYNPWKLEYVPKTDKRRKICKQLYNRLYDETDWSPKKRPQKPKKRKMANPHDR